MPEKLAITTQDAPAAIGPYSQAVRVGDTVYTSGQVALDPATVSDTLGVLLKYQDDIAKVHGAEAARIVTETAVG